MSIKIALLKSGEQVISDAKELISEEKNCGYLFENPHKIEIRYSYLSEESDNSTDLEISLSPWIVLSSDKKILVPVDSVITIVEPIDTLKEMYEEKVNGKDNKMSFTKE